MNEKKAVGIMLISIFLFIAALAGIIFAQQYLDSEKSSNSYSTLAESVNNSVEHNDMSDEALELSEVDLKALEAAAAYEKYGALYEQNSDFAGWISIEGTKVNYPVMQTPDSPGYYLKHAFDGTYSDWGVPYIDEACTLGFSKNIVIYGHHMNDGSMFADLCQYTQEDFYNSHKTVQFDTLSSFGTYDIVAVFRFDTNRDPFRYNRYVNMNEERFKYFMDQVHARQLYDTGVDAEYGDELLTLSTCDYYYKNGRFVVIAKKVN